MKKKYKYVAEVVIETDKPILYKDIKSMIVCALEDMPFKARVRSVDDD